MKNVKKEVLICSPYNINLRSWRKIKMVVSFRSVSIVNTKLRIAGANFWGKQYQKNSRDNNKRHSSLQVY